MLVQNPMWLYRLYPTTWLHISPTEILVLVATDQLTCYNQLWHPMLLKYPCLGEIHMFLRPVAAAAQTLPPRLAAEDCLTGKVWTVCTWLLKFKAPLSGGKTFGMNLGTSRIFLRDFAWKIFRTHWKKKVGYRGSSQWVYNNPWSPNYVQQRLAILPVHTKSICGVYGMVLIWAKVKRLLQVW